MDTVVLGGTRAGAALVPVPPPIVVVEVVVYVGRGRVGIYTEDDLLVLVEYIMVGLAGEKVVGGMVVGFLDTKTGRAVRLGGNSSRTVPGTTNGISSLESAINNNVQVSLIVCLMLCNLGLSITYWHL